MSDSRVSRRYNSWANYDPQKRHEFNDGVSKTVPNQALSIREIFHRFASGQPINVDNGMVYTGDSPTPDLRKYDIEEIHEMKRANEAEIDRVSKELRTKSSDRKVKLEQERLEKEARAKQLDIEDGIAAAKKDKDKGNI